MASSHTMPGLFPPGRPIQRQCPAERCVCINSQAPTSLRTWCSTPTQLSSENPRCFLVSDEVFIFLLGSLSVQLMIYCSTFFFKSNLFLVYAVTTAKNVIINSTSQLIEKLSNDEESWMFNALSCLSFFRVRVRVSSGSHVEKADTRRWWTWRRICPPDNYIIGRLVMKMLMSNNM